MKTRVFICHIADSCCTSEKYIPNVAQVLSCRLQPAYQDCNLESLQKDGLDRNIRKLCTVFSHSEGKDIHN